MEQEKRTPTKLLKAKVYREDMTFAEEKDFVKYMLNVCVHTHT